MDPDHLPMFPQTRRRILARPGFEFHRASCSLSTKLIRAFQYFAYTDALMAAPLSYAVRFTDARSQLVQQKKASLCWSSLSLWITPTSAMSGMPDYKRHVQAQFSRKIAVQMAPIVEMLTGRVIQNGAAATRPDATSRIIDLRIDQSGADMGSCGTHALCHFDKPVSCYGCHNFQTRNRWLP